MLANGYGTCYWGVDNGGGMGFDNVTVPLENPDASVNISAGSSHTFLVKEGERAYVSRFVEPAVG